jgi:hypothetical protein
MKSHTEDLVFETRKRREMVHIPDEVEEMVRRWRGEVLPSRATILKVVIFCIFGGVEGNEIPVSGGLEGDLNFKKQVKSAFFSEGGGSWGGGTGVWQGLKPCSYLFRGLFGRAEAGPCYGHGLGRARRRCGWGLTGNRCGVSFVKAHRLHVDIQQE